MLAIIIPYYKISFFEVTLKSLADQTDKNFKVYIGDDASPDNPSELLNKYKGLFSFEYHKFETNIGGSSLVKQWERCICLSQDEEWIMILGDDDLLEDTCVASFYNNLDEIKSLGVNVIRFSTQIINQHGERISEIYQHPKVEKSTDFLKRKLKGGTRSSLSEYVFKSEVVRKIKFKNLPLAWYSDLLAVLEFSFFDSIFTINNAIVYFRLSGINITARRDNLVLKNVATFQYYYYLLANKKEFLDKELRESLLFRLEKTFLDNKKNVYFWLPFTKLYISGFYFRRYFIFVGKMLSSILKKIRDIV